MDKRRNFNNDILDLKPVHGRKSKSGLDLLNQFMCCLASFHRNYVIDRFVKNFNKQRRYARITFDHSNFAATKQVFNSIRLHAKSNLVKFIES